MSDVRLGGLLLLLIAVVIAAAYAGRTTPVSPRQWRWVWITFVFLIWLLAGFLSIRGLCGNP
jgi:hypothetical protein